MAAGDTLSSPSDSGAFPRGTRIDDLIVLTTAFRTAHWYQTTANCGLKLCTILIIGVSSPRACLVGFSRTYGVLRNIYPLSSHPCTSCPSRGCSDLSAEGNSASPRQGSGAPCRTKRNALRTNYLVNATCADRIVSLTDDKLQVLKSADKDSAARWVRID